MIIEVLLYFNSVNQNVKGMTASTAIQTSLNRLNQIALKLQMLHLTY